SRFSPPCRLKTMRYPRPKSCAFRTTGFGAWRLKFLWCLVLGFWCCLPLRSSSSPAPDGQWPMWRHDSVITGHQPLPGAMKEAPRILAKYFVGTQQGIPTFADLRGTGETNDIIIAARARLTAYDPKGNRLWEFAPEG